MFGIALAAMCSAIAWAIAFKRTAVIGDPDPFGFVTWPTRAVLIGGGLIACLVVARYLTYRPGRGLRLGLANFVLLAAGLISFFCLLFYVRQGGDLADVTAVVAFASRVVGIYGACAFASFAAFLASEVLLARL